MKCPYCNTNLKSLGKFSSTPCHFSYDEDAPSYIDGELFECDNVGCEERWSQFYSNTTYPGEIFQGSPDV